MAAVRHFLRRVICLPIYGYQWLISPVLSGSCRYYPSCSEYGIIAINQLGIVKGLFRLTCRILRCHPWSAGGYDPVLPKDEKY